MQMLCKISHRVYGKKFQWDKEIVEALAGLRRFANVLHKILRIIRVGNLVMTTMVLI